MSANPRVEQSARAGMVHVATLLILWGSVSAAYAQAHLDSDSLLGEGLERMQALVVTAHAMQAACTQAFPKLGEQFRGDLRTHIQTERALYAKLNETWLQLAAERRDDVQAYYWVLEGRTVKKLRELEQTSSNTGALETECKNFFFDLRTGAIRRAAPELFSTLDEFVAGKNPHPPTFPFLDDIAEKRTRGN
jgi:hypothetical protein